MKNEKTINVNELDRILQKHFKCKHIFITRISFGDCTIPNLKHSLIGVGGRLDISFETSRKLK